MKNELKEAYEALSKHRELNTFDLSKENKVHAQVLFDEANRRSRKIFLKTIDWHCSNCVSTAKTTVFNMMAVLDNEINLVADKMVVHEKPVKQISEETEEVLMLTFNDVEYKELKAMAKEMGMKFKGNPSKQKLINFIENAGK